MALSGCLVNIGRVSSDGEGIWGAPEVLYLLCRGGDDWLLGKQQSPSGRDPEPGLGGEMVRREGWSTQVPLSLPSVGPCLPALCLGDTETHRGAETSLESRSEAGGEAFLYLGLLICEIG